MRYGYRQIIHAYNIRLKVKLHAVHIINLKVKIILNRVKFLLIIKGDKKVNFKLLKYQSRPH